MKRIILVILMLVLFSMLNTVWLEGTPKEFKKEFKKEYKVVSPDKRITVKVELSDKVYYSVYLGEEKLLERSPVSMTLKWKEKTAVLGENPRVVRMKRNGVNGVLKPVVRRKSAGVKEHYNELTISFKKKYGLIFRAYNEGVAYRFSTMYKKNIRVISEEVCFNFAGDYKVYFPEEKSFFSHNERQYVETKLSEISNERFCSLPALAAAESGVKIGILEADLEDYPGLWLRGDNGTKLVGKLPGVALEVKQERDRHVKVTKYADYIAETEGKRSFPWRVLAIAEQDGDLITNELTYLLGAPLRLKDTSWIKPGKVAWDWYNYNNIYGVDFRAGVNTETYKYFIDFASGYGIEYIILDEGWYKLGNLLDIVPEMDMEELLAYGKKKNVGIILWVIWKTLDDQLTEALDQFEKWGVKGIKVDFMQRDDQWMVNYYHRIAKEAAKRHLLVDFHGSYKPAGLRRTYPNVLTREGVKGLENNKWSKLITPGHNVTLPFIRMLAGPMDYTPGAVSNAREENFHPVFKRPMSMGTRCHHLAMYVIYESPLQMLADSPSNYMRERECMEFLSRAPVVWDETVVLHAKMGDYIALARKSADEWYIGAMTDETAREMTIDFSFLEAGSYKMDIYRDGINADRCAVDYKKIGKRVKSGDKLNIKLAPGGGWVARVTR